MARMTIAQMRERDVFTLSERNQELDFDNARRLMNSYYRLCALCERNLYLANDERTCNTRWCKESEEKESRWYERLKKEFSAYGLTLVYYGYFPSIVDSEKKYTAIWAHFY